MGRKADVTGRVSVGGTPLNIRVYRKLQVQISTSDTGYHRLDNTWFDVRGGCTFGEHGWRPARDWELTVGAGGGTDVEIRQLRSRATEVVLQTLHTWARRDSVRPKLEELLASERTLNERTVNLLRKRLADTVAPTEQEIEQARDRAAELERLQQQARAELDELERAYQASRSVLYDRMRDLRVECNQVLRPVGRKGEIRQWQADLEQSLQEAEQLQAQRGFLTAAGQVELAVPVPVMPGIGLAALD